MKLIIFLNKIFPKRHEKNSSYQTTTQFSKVKLKNNKIVWRFKNELTEYKLLKIQLKSQNPKTI